MELRGPKGVLGTTMGPWTIKGSSYRGAWGPKEGLENMRGPEEHKGTSFVVLGPLMVPDLHVFPMPPLKSQTPIVVPCPIVILGTLCGSQAPLWLPGPPSPIVVLELLWPPGPHFPLWPLALLRSLGPIVVPRPHCGP